MMANYAAQNSNMPGHQIPFYNAQQQPSPEDSVPPTPNNISPTSPKDNFLKYYLPNQVRQLRPPKSPLYVPAALRPNERNPRPSPMTPPKSLHGSLDSLDGAFETSMGTEEQSTLDQFQHIVQEELGEVSGPPTRQHWKPDDASPSCDSPKCHSNFNLFIRKHHCRYCGHIFCSEHSGHEVPLNQDAKFHSDGISSRACDSCYQQYQKWDTARSLVRKNSDGSTGSGNTTPLVGAGVGGPRGYRSILSRQIDGKQKAQDNVASSMPKDWNWSTF